MTAHLGPPAGGGIVDELSALDAIVRVAARSPGVSGFLGEATRLTQELTRCVGIAVYVVDDAGRTLTLLHQRGIPEQVSAQVASAPVVPPAVFTIPQSDADVIDPSAYPARFRPAFEQTGIRTLARVPLLVGSRIVGVLAVGFSERGPETAERHLRFLRAVGALTAAVINSARLLGDLQRRVSELTLLNDLAVASAQLDPVLLLDGAVRRIAEVFGCEMGAAFLREGEQLHNVSLFGVRPEAIRAARVVGIGTGPAGAAVALRDVVVYPDPEAAGGSFAENLRGEGIHAVVGVPLLTKGEPVGGMALGRRTDPPFTEEDRRFLRALGAQLGVAVENSRLYAAARRQVAHLESVRALALRVFVHPPGELTALLTDGCREIASALAAPGAAAYLVTDDGRSLQCHAVHGVDPASLREEIPLDGDGLGPDAVHLGQARQTADTHADPRCAALGDHRAPPASLLAVPLGSRDAVRGVVYVSDRPGRLFDDQEVALARALAATLEVGLENAGLEVDLGRSNAELQVAQARLLQGERLAALGALSAAVAHEVRNPLGVIFNAVGMLRRHPAARDEEGRALVDMVAEEAERLNRIVTDLLGFARPPAAAIHAAPLAPIVEEAVRAALAGVRTPIQTALDLARDLPPVAIDAGLVRQAVINVVMNAVQAMGRGGRLLVRTALAGEATEIEVSDNGPGIPDAVRARIFEPFFTTKTSGTGLGLAIVKHVVEVHGGAVEVGTVAGGGTRFVLRFPLARAAGEPAPIPPSR
ncbi:MAG: GAF domain-containing protein [Anaeromyxobacteraceae bacterium]